MSLNVLAVDDSRTIRDMLRLTLTGAGMETHLAEDGVHGLEMLEEIEMPDAIITDINMPRLDGFGFIDAVRAKSQYRGVPILVLTTESAPEMKARARAAGTTIVTASSVSTAGRRNVFIIVVSSIWTYWPRPERQPWPPSNGRQQLFALSASAQSEGYSVRNASLGSTRVARNTGTEMAARATASMTSTP